MVDRDRLQDLASALRGEGLDADLDETGVIRVGPRQRGPEALPADVIADDDDLAEFFVVLTEKWGDGRFDLAPDRVVMALVEDLTALHDGSDTNLTTRIRLRRDGRGHLGLQETRADPATRRRIDGDGYTWVADPDTA